MAVEAAHREIPADFYDLSRRVKKSMLLLKDAGLKLPCVVVWRKKLAQTHSSLGQHLPEAYPRV
jgi:hypothetical protein